MQIVDWVSEQISATNTKYYCAFRSCFYSNVIVPYCIMCGEICRWSDRLVMVQFLLIHSLTVPFLPGSVSFALCWSCASGNYDFFSFFSPTLSQFISLHDVLLCRLLNALLQKLIRAWMVPRSKRPVCGKKVRHFYLFWVLWIRSGKCLASIFTYQN
jgi:hypothetical protein